MNGNFFKGKVFAITGANGTLGKSLTKLLKQKEAFVIGLSHKLNVDEKNEEAPDRWILWECGKENDLIGILSEIDILIINHGINTNHNIDDDITKSIEINAMSSWRLIKIFEKLNNSHKKNSPREIWVNTSEAEILPAFSPTYELSKVLIGQIVSLKKNTASKKDKEKLIFRKLVLGSFKSSLNPIGILNSEFVANQILKLANKGFSLIIVSPNPITYLLMPITEISRILYSRFIKYIYQTK